MRIITSQLLRSVCKDVRVELQLQPLTGESFAPSTATRNEVRLDVGARRFWQADQMAFFDVRVFNSNARRYAEQELSKHINSMKKRRNTSTMSELRRLNTAHLHHLCCLQPEEWDKNHRNFIRGYRS